MTFHVYVFDYILVNICAIFAQKLVDGYFVRDDTLNLYL